MKTWLNIAIAFVLFVLFWFGYDLYLSKQIEKHYKEEVNKVFNLSERDKGLALARISERAGNITILGSSELSGNYTQMPSSFFPRESIPAVTIVGGAYSQSLIHIMGLSAMNVSEDSKIVFIVSPQWFWGDGINRNGFSAKFSPLRYYNYLLDNVPEKDKQYVSKRIISGIKPNASFVNAYIYSVIYSRENAVFKPIQYAAALPLMLDRAYLSTKDKHQAYKYLVKNELKTGKTETAGEKIDWENEKQKAAAEGEKQISNNDIFVKDDYFDTYLRETWDESKNKSVDMAIMTNKEYEDYELFLKTCKIKNIRPLIIIPPCNGYFYDYIGITKDKRTGQYSRLESMAKEYGFPVFSMAEYDYEPYVLSDIMHTGWLGWIYINEKIVEHFN